MSQTKVTVKIFKPLLKSFERQIEALFIKRDAFLNSVIQEEIKHLARDMQGKRLSSKANRYISGELKRLDPHPVNIVVDRSTADALNAVVKETNIVRDAFFNRLIYLLRPSTDFFSYFDLPEFINGSEFESGIDPMPTSPLQAMAAVQNDPLYYLREGAEERLKTGLYLIDLPSEFVGFTCYLDDTEVPETEAYTQSQIESDKALDELQKSIEAKAFQKPKATAEVKL
jgi:hypothetical protein